MIKEDEDDLEREKTDSEIHNVSKGGDEDFTKGARELENRHFLHLHAETKNSQYKSTLDCSSDHQNQVLSK